MGSTSFDKIVKEIDALTYNARSILQALQDSTVAAGSANGFSVVRAGKIVTVSRIDIYRLYQFYRAWEENNFSDVNVPATSSSKALTGYNDLRIQYDATPVYDDNGNVTTTTATSTALANHARLLYLTGDNASQFDVDSYWYNLIPTAANPKLVTSSAPIPINLRTPIFDPNLSTTKYNTQPTYLFPMGYYRLDLLGYENDSVDHNLGGNSWTIKGDSYVNITSPAVSMGGVDPLAPYKTNIRRTGNYATDWGYDSHARGKNSTAGGLNSIASGAGSVAIGDKAYASGSDSVSIGGFYGISPGMMSGTVAGSYLASHAKHSGILGGYLSVTGEPYYDFTLRSISGSSANCFDACASTCNDTDGTTNIPGYNAFNVSANIAVVNWNVGDHVILYALTTKYSTSIGNSYDSTNGDGFVSYTRTIMSISADPDNLTSKSIVTVDQSIPFSYVVGGRIARSYNVSRAQEPGYASAIAGGIGLVANGYAQLVTGQYNDYGILGTRDRRDAKFIVGAGTSSTSRVNAFEVYADGFGAYAAPGVDIGSVGAKGMVLDSTGFSVMHMGNSLSLQSNSYGGYTFDATVINTDGDAAGVYATWRGALLNAGVRSAGNANLISSSYPNIANVNITDVNAKGAYIVGDKVYTYATDYNATIDNSYFVNSANSIYLQSKGDTTLSFRELNLIGNTYGALPTPYDSRSFVADSSKYGTDISVTAFHELMLTGDPFLSGAIVPSDRQLGLVSGDLRNSHLITVASAPRNNTVFTMQMMWGQATAANVLGSNQGSISIRKGIIPINSGLPGYSKWETLATESYVDSKAPSTLLTLPVTVTLAYSTGSTIIDTTLYTMSSFTLTKNGHLGHIECTLHINAYALGVALADTPITSIAIDFSIDTSVDNNGYKPISMGHTHNGLIYNGMGNVGTVGLSQVIPTLLRALVYPTGMINSSDFRFGFTLTYKNMITE